MDIKIIDAVRPKSVAEWGQIVESHYAARDAGGYVRQPNWVVYAARFDANGEWSGLGEVVDIIPAVPEEIPPPHPTLPRQMSSSPMDTRPIAARLGYSCERYEFKLDFTGAYTGAFIQHHRSEHLQ